MRLKTPWRDGTNHIALQPLELGEKLAACREVVDFGRPQVEKGSSGRIPKKVIDSHNRTCAELMRRGGDIDVLAPARALLELDDA